MRYYFCPHCMTEIDSSSAYCPCCGRETDYTPGTCDLVPGTELTSEKGNTYRIGKKLGAGGFGITYIAKITQTGVTVAIKEYFPVGMLHSAARVGLCPNIIEEDRDKYNQCMEKFEKEASMLAALKNIPHVVHVIDYFSANDTSYMVMEYLAGTTLKDLMQTQERFEPIYILRKMLPLMRNIQELHKSDVLHRDIAPDNIMVMPDGSLKLLDFGSARSTAVNEHTVNIKPGFTPLEQYQKTGQNGFTDVYSTAATIYYCITGQIPTPAPERLFEIKVNGHPDPIVPPSQCNIDLPADIEQLLMWCLELQPDSRVQTMKEAADMLEKALSALQPEPPDPDPHHDLVSDSAPPRRNIAAVVAIGAGLITLLIILLNLPH